MQENTSPSINNNNIELISNCGIFEETRPFILYGKRTTIGEYPWLAAMFFNNQFRCASSLITDRFVVTAAHCVVIERNIVPKEAIALFLGSNNLMDRGPQVQTRGVRNVHVHPEYIRPSDADIAVFELGSPVQFTQTVKPICLSLRAAEQMIGSEGLVAGWGKDENYFDYVMKARQIRLPVVSKEICLNRDYYNYGKLMSSRTFCAGE